MTTYRPFFRPLRAAAAVLAVFAAFAPAFPLSASEIVNRILIHVNSRIITQSQFDARLDQNIRENGAPATPALREDMKKSVMEELVNEALLEDRAKELDLITTDQEIEEQIKRLKEQNNVKTDEEFTKSLAASGLTIDRLRDQLRRSQTLQRVVGREVQAKVDLSDDALRLIYEREKETWRIPEKAHLAEILISKGDDPAAAARRAKEASDLLKGGAKFEAVVKDFSDGGTRAKGGDLGIVAKGELAADIDKAVFSLPVGAVSDPIQTKFGWHLVKVLEKVPVSYKPFGEVKADLLKREQDTQFQKKLAEYLDKLKREAVIRVNEPAKPYFTAPAPAPGSSVTVATRDATAEGDARTLPAATEASRDARIEITPAVGWRFGGRTAEPGTAAVDTVKIPDSLSWGATVEIPFAPWGSFEALWSHQNSELSAVLTGSAPAGTEPKLAHLNMDTLQLGALWQSGDAASKARLYFDLLFGVTMLNPSPGFASLTRFSGSVGGGVKYYVADHFGLRLGGRWTPVYLKPGEGAYESCADGTGCVAYYGSSTFWQGDAYGGLIVRF